MVLPLSGAETDVQGLATTPPTPRVTVEGGGRREEDLREHKQGGVLVTVPRMAGRTGSVAFAASCGVNTSSADFKPLR